MPKVIDKTFAILEEIVKNAPHPVLPSDLADPLEINRTTCSRLLKNLLDGGYILKVSRQLGYVPGPKILTLNNMANFQSELLQKSAPVVDRCAGELKKLVLVAQLYGGKRYIIYHKNCDPDQTIRLQELAFDDLFSTATGLLLLAYSSPAEQKRCFQEQLKNGGEFFPGFTDWEHTCKTLETIRRQGYFECEKLWQWIYAYPIFRRGKFCAAFGVSILKSEYNPEYDKSLRLYLEQAAQTISNSLSPLQSIG